MAALTPNQLDMIRAIATNDMPRARKAAQAALAEDESKKNYWDVGELKRMLDPSMNPWLAEVPYEIKGLIEVERPAESFIVERYWLSPREKEAFEHIVTMRSVCGKLAQMRVSYPNSTLLYGPSGTGKTTFGRYVACKLDLPFYYMNFARVMDSHLGGTQRNVAKVFDYARSAPCVLMLDEIDAISVRRRNAGNVDGELNRVTITIMQELDKCNGHMVLIGATNRRDVLDEAILRRFSLHHEVTPPQTAEEAAQVMRAFLDDLSNPLFKVQYDTDFVANLCKENPGKPQSWLVNKAIESVAKQLADEEFLKLT